MREYDSLLRIASMIFNFSVIVVDVLVLLFMMNIMPKWLMTSIAQFCMFAQMKCNTNWHKELNTIPKKKSQTIIFDRGFFFVSVRLVFVRRSNEALTQLKHKKPIFSSLCRLHVFLCVLFIVSDGKQISGNKNKP